MRFLKSLVFPGSFMPHGYCNLCIHGLIGLHVLSDSPIALSYQSIPIYLVRLFYTYREPASSRITRLPVTQQLPRHPLTICTEKPA